MFELEISFKILVACILGGLIGFFREKEKKSAGLKTHTLVCIGSCLFTLVSIFMSQSNPGSDAGRIAANIVVGIGFIGAGTIIQDSGMVVGITTAASIWIAAAIGMSIGIGFYYAAIFTAIISILVLYFGPTIEKKYIRGGKD